MIIQGRMYMIQCTKYMPISRKMAHHKGRRQEFTAWVQRVKNDNDNTLHCSYTLIHSLFFIYLLKTWKTVTDNTLFHTIKNYSLHCSPPFIITPLHLSSGGGTAHYAYTQKWHSVYCLQKCTMNSVNCVGSHSYVFQYIPWACLLIHG